MDKVFSRTSSCGLKVMFAALQILSEQDGSSRVAELRSAIAKRVEFSDWEMEQVNGSPRWFTFFSYYSTTYSVAGFIRKSRGT